MTKLYRLLTGPEDATFCHKVTKALNEGWSLYGSPTMVCVGDKVMCGQAVTKTSKSAYVESKPLSDQ